MQDNFKSPHWEYWFVYKVPYDNSSSQVQVPQAFVVQQTKVHQVIAWGWRSTLSLCSTANHLVELAAQAGSPLSGCAQTSGF